MRQKIFITIIAILMLVTALPSTGTPKLKKEIKKERVKIKDLDKRYKDWWDLVTYIITPTEKEVFLNLTTNHDRDAFINLFWQLRDPTKGTPQNEYKDEHIKRFEYANRYFRGSPAPGWMSDRGRIYILLGPPVNSDEIEQNGLYPVLIWEYYGSPEKGLPTVFNIVFYKRNGAGDYRMYIPAVDGPGSLLRPEIGSVDLEDFYTVYNEIYELSPTVAGISLSLIPGEGTQYYSPSMQDPLLISNIYELPKKRINTTYARNFLNYKGLVETNVITNYINIKSDLYILKDPVLNLNFVHFALLPERISVDYSPEKDQYYFAYDLLVVLKKGEEIIFQYNKNFPFYYSQLDLDQKLSHGIIIQDYFPVIPGDYSMVVLLQNTMNKEVSYYERQLHVEPVSTSQPRVFGPLMSYAINLPAQQVFAPFNIMGSIIKVDPQKTFSLKDPLYCTFCVDRGKYSKPIKIQLDIQCQDERRPYQKTYSFEMPDKKEFQLFTQKLEKLNYGNYNVIASVLGENNAILEKEERGFVVSPLSFVPHPPFANKSLRMSNRFLFYSMIGQQYENLDELSKAESYYEKAYNMNPTYPQLLKLYAGLLLKLEKYEKMLTVIENLKNIEKELFTYYSLRGRGLYQMGRYQEAVDTLLEANNIFDSDISVLNTLGVALLRINEKGEAIKALSASLKIDPQQEDIAKLLEQLQGGKKNEKKSE